MSATLAEALDNSIRLARIGEAVLRFISAPDAGDLTVQHATVEETIDHLKQLGLKQPSGFAVGGDDSDEVAHG